jgi:hypothetical protein
MTNNLLISTIISIVYLLFKFFDMRFIKKQNLPIKDLILDSCVVFVSSLLTFFLFDQFNLNDILSGESASAPEAFVDTPNF